jgi:hypothetical protein
MEQIPKPMEQIPKPMEQNFKDIRNYRQENNYKVVYDSIKTNDMKTFSTNINDKELQRTLRYLNLTAEELIKVCIEGDTCSNLRDICCKLLSMNIAKNSSRQGSKDEIEQLRTCNITAQLYGLTITNLTATELRPTKDGLILSKTEMKTKGISKDCCLKSFDGQISGKMNGFIAAKVVYGSGGHQDNVFEEMDTLAEWWKTYKCEMDEILIILIDTDLTTKVARLKEKYNDVNNILVFNHIEFQQYIINKYHNDESA